MFSSWFIIYQHRPGGSALQPDWSSSAKDFFDAMSCVHSQNRCYARSSGSRNKPNGSQGHPASNHGWWNSSHGQTPQEDARFVPSLREAFLSHAKDRFSWVVESRDPKQILNQFMILRACVCRKQISFQAERCWKVLRLNFEKVADWQTTMPQTLLEHDRMISNDYPMTVHCGLALPSISAGSNAPPAASQRPRFDPTTGPRSPSADEHQALAAWGAAGVLSSRAKLSKHAHTQIYNDIYIIL